MEALKEQIFAATGKPFDLRDASALQKNLSAVLSKAAAPPDIKAGKPGQDAVRAKATGADKLALPKRRSGRHPAQRETTRESSGRQADGPAGGFQLKHAVIAPLLEFRRLEATHPRLAEKSVAEALVKQKRQAALAQYQLQDEPCEREGKVIVLVSRKVFR